MHIKSLGLEVCWGWGKLSKQVFFIIIRNL